MKNVQLRHVIFAALLVAIGIVLTSVLSISYPPNSTIIRFGIGYLPLILISIVLGPKIGFSAAIIQDLLGYFVYFWIHGYTSGPFYLGFTLNSVLYGVLPGLIYHLKIRRFDIFKYVNFTLLLVMFGLGVWGFFNIQEIISLIESRVSSEMQFDPWVIYLMLAIGEIGILGTLAFLFYKRNASDAAHRIIFITIVLQVLVTLILTPLWVTNLYHIPFWPQLPLRIIKTPVEIFIYAVLVIRIVKAFESYGFSEQLKKWTCKEMKIE